MFAAPVLVSLELVSLMGGGLCRSGKVLPEQQDWRFGVASFQVAILASVEFPSLDASSGDACPPGISVVMQSATVTTGTNSSS